MNEIRIQTNDKKSPYSRWAINRKNAVEFSEDPKFRINSKNISLKDFQNNSARDCNIYEVIEKYRGDLKMSAEQLNQFHNEVNDELTRIKNLPDALMAIKEGEQAWRNLPLDTRAQFGNSVQNFLKNGNKYFSNEISKYNKLQEEIKLKQQEQIQLDEKQLELNKEKL